MIVVTCIPNIKGSSNNYVKSQSTLSHYIINFLSLEIHCFYMIAAFEYIK